MLQVYWVGPILGAVLAAALYEYLYCPDPELKERLKQVFQKDPASGKYREVDGMGGEADGIAIKPGTTTTCINSVDLEKKMDPFLRDSSSGDVLSSV